MIDFHNLFSYQNALETRDPLPQDTLHSGSDHSLQEDMTFGFTDDQSPNSSQNCEKEINK